MNIAPGQPAHLSAENNADHTGKEGYAVKWDSGKAALMDSDSALTVMGVITEGAESGKNDSIVHVNSGEKVLAKLAATPGSISRGTKLGTHTDGSFKATASSKNACAEYVDERTATANGLHWVVLYKPELTA